MPKFHTKYSTADLKVLLSEKRGRINRKTSSLSLDYSSTIEIRKSGFLPNIAIDDCLKNGSQDSSKICFLTGKIHEHPFFVAEIIMAGDKKSIPYFGRGIDSTIEDCRLQIQTGTEGYLSLFCAYSMSIDYIETKLQSKRIISLRYSPNGDEEDDVRMAMGFEQLEYSLPFRDEGDYYYVLNVKDISKNKKQLLKKLLLRLQ